MAVKSSFSFVIFFRLDWSSGSHLILTSMVSLWIEVIIWIIRLCIQACMHRVTYYFFPFFDFFSTFCVAYWRYPWKKMSPHWPCDTFLAVCQAICETFRPAHNGKKQILNEHFISINLYFYQIIVLIIDFLLQEWQCKIFGN